MGLKTDFSQAVKDITSSLGLDRSLKEDVAENILPKEEIIEIKEEPSFVIPRVTPADEKEFSPFGEPITDFREASSSVKQPTMMVISPRTVLKGNIDTDDSMEVMGIIHGEITCKSSIDISGKVFGNVKCKKFSSSKAEIQGDIICSGDLVIGEGTHIEGNVVANIAEINGSVNGNIHIKETVVIDRTAVINGDIAAGLIELKKGAYVKGSVTMGTDVK